MSNIKVSVKADYSQLNQSEILKKVDKSNESLGYFASSSWWKLYTPYVPMQTGALFQTVELKPWEVVHEMFYANKQYNGDFNFRTNKHPLATRKWDQAAISAGKSTTLANDIQGFIESGGAGI